jgi:hypothetical protein
MSNVKLTWSMVSRHFNVNVTATSERGWQTSFETLLLRNGKEFRLAKNRERSPHEKASGASFCSA